MAKPDFKTAIEAIRDQSEITDVIGSYVQLKRAGSSLKACCPFHKEKSPSFHVNTSKQTFHCFGCDAGGDVFNFIMRYENIEFMQAARLLAERANMPFEFDRDGSGANRSLKNDLYRLHDELKVWYQRCLRESGQAETARHYLAEREIDEKAIEQFGIGYAPARNVNWPAWATKHSFSLDLLVQGGVLIMREEGGWYDRFANRLMFPIHDESGRVIAFSGRILPGDTRPAKYVNSPETALFTKSRVIYALHLAKRNILDAKEAILCEGQIDVVRCHIAGFTHAVAAQGTAVTEQHARILKRFAETIRIAMDSDSAGQNAAVRTSDILQEAELDVRVACLPDGEDPDSVIRRDGPDAFRTILAAAVPALDFKVDFLLGQEGTPNDATFRKATREIIAGIARIPNELHRSQLLQRAGERLGIRPDILESELRKQTSRKTPRRDEPAPEEAPTPPKNQDHCQHPREEEEVVRLLLHSPETATLLATYISPRQFTSPACRELFETVIAHAVEEHFDLMAELLTSGSEVRRVAAKLMAEDRFTGSDFEPEKAAQDLIISIYRREFEQQRRSLEALSRKASAHKMEENETSIEELIMHLHTLRTGWVKAKPLLDLQRSLFEDQATP